MADKPIVLEYTPGQGKFPGIRERASCIPKGISFVQETRFHRVQDLLYEKEFRPPYSVLFNALIRNCNSFVEQGALLWQVSAESQLPAWAPSLPCIFLTSLQKDSVWLAS